MLLRYDNKVVRCSYLIYLSRLIVLQWSAPISHCQNPVNTKAIRILTTAVAVSALMVSVASTATQSLKRLTVSSLCDTTSLVTMIFCSCSRLIEGFYQRGSIASYEAMWAPQHRCLSLRVCPYVTVWCCIKTNKASVMITLPTESPKTLVYWKYPVHPEPEIRKGSPGARAIHETVVGTNWRFSTYKQRYLRNGAR